MFKFKFDKDKKEIQIVTTDEKIAVAKVLIDKGTIVSNAYDYTYKAAVKASSFDFDYSDYLNAIDIRSIYSRNMKTSMYKKSVDTQKHPYTSVIRNYLPIEYSYEPHKDYDAYPVRKAGVDVLKSFGHTGDSIKVYKDATIKCNDKILDITTEDVLLIIYSSI